MCGKIVDTWVFFVTSLSGGLVNTGGIIWIFVQNLNADYNAACNEIISHVQIDTKNGTETV